MAEGRAGRHIERAGFARPHSVRPDYAQTHFTRPQLAAHQEHTGTQVSLAGSLRSRLPSRAAHAIGQLECESSLLTLAL